MKSIGLKVLKNKLSEYVARAERGETVLVTNHDRVVAKLMPAAPEDALPHKESVFERGIREGWITPAKVKGPLPAPPPAVMTLEEMLEDLDWSRADRDLP
jgi:prevent-host-death family protein